MKIPREEVDLLFCNIMLGQHCLTNRLEVNSKPNSALDGRWDGGPSKACCYIILCRIGEIGKHMGLKIPRRKSLIGSTPLSGTIPTGRNACGIYFLIVFLVA